MKHRETEDELRWLHRRVLLLAFILFVVVLTLRLYNDDLRDLRDDVSALKKAETPTPITRLKKEDDVEG